MKFLYVGDLHERSSPPRNRKDNWKETYNAKIEEIRSIAKNNNVKAILHGGDFFSKHKYDTEFLSEVLNRWGYKNYNEKLLQEGVLIKGIDEPPLISPIGNHDLLGSSLKSYHKTSLSFLESIGFITIANKERPLIFKEDDFTVAITGGHYELDMDETKEPYLIDEKQGDYHIHIVHGMLTDHKWFDGVPHTTIDEIAHTKADLTIAGHDHKGFAKVEHDGKIFVNPGSPFRMSTDEIKRKPKVMLIEITNDGIETKFIYLKSAKPGEDVLDLTQKEKKERKSNTLKEIKEKIKESSKTGASINEIIKSIAKESDVEESIINSSIDRVANKMNQDTLNAISESSKLTSPYYITSLDLINFASHERTTFNFNKGLNVFVGATASGKTTCFRALKWIYDDDGNSKRFIKKDANFCEATISTSHGYTITRFIHPKGKKTKDGKTVKNGYEITYPDGNIEVTNTKGVEIVREILSYNKLDLESKEIDLNFLEQGSSWFFIGDKYTTTDRAKMIGAIHKTHFVDLAIKELEADNKKLNLKRDTKTEEINKIQDKIDSFKYLEDFKTKLELINSKKEKLMILVEKRDKLEKILKDREIINNDIIECDKVINNINSKNLKKAITLISNTREQLYNLDKLESILKKLQDVTSNIENQDKILSQIKSEDLDNAKRKIAQIKDNLLKFENLDKIENTKSKLVNDIATCNKYIEKINNEDLKTSKIYINSIKTKLDVFSKLNTVLYKQEKILLEVKKITNESEKINPENLELAKRKINDLKEKIVLRDKLIEILNKRHEIRNEGLRMNKEIKHHQDILENELIKYQDLLSSYGTCPICNSKIDKIIAKQIVEKKRNK